MIGTAFSGAFPVEAVYGLHNWPGIPVGEMAGHARPVMAGTCAFEISVRAGCRRRHAPGGGRHRRRQPGWSRPPGPWSARSLHPCDAAVVGVTQVHAGGAWNVIPRRSSAGGHPGLQARGPGRVEQAVEQLCSGIAAAR